LAAEGFNVLMNAMVEAQLFHDFGVGRSSEVRLTHL